MPSYLLSCLLIVDHTKQSETKHLSVQFLLLQHQYGTEGLHEERMFPNAQAWTARAGCIVGEAGFVCYCCLFHQLPAVCSFPAVSPPSTGQPLSGGSRTRDSSQQYMHTLSFQRRRVLQLLSISSAFTNKRFTTEP